MNVTNLPGTITFNIESMLTRKLIVYTGPAIQDQWLQTITAGIVAAAHHWPLPPEPRRCGALVDSLTRSN